MVWETLGYELEKLIFKKSLQMRALKLLFRVLPRALPEYLMVKSVKENSFGVRPPREHSVQCGGAEPRPLAITRSHSSCV